MGTNSHKEKMFELGRSFDAGLISFDNLSTSEKYMLNKYYIQKNDRIDSRIDEVENSLTSMETRLNNIYNNLSKID